MRKLYLLLLVCMGVLCSCEGPMGPMGPQGPKGDPGQAATFTIVRIDVPQSSWNYSNVGNNNYFYATVEMPEITEQVFDGSLIKMYRTFNYDTMDATQMEMPYVRVNEAQLEDQSWVFYTETVDYDYGIGKMTIYYAASDFDYELNPQFIPEAMTFRCVIVY